MNTLTPKYELVKFTNAVKSHISLAEAAGVPPEYPIHRVYREVFSGLIRSFIDRSNKVHEGAPGLIIDPEEWSEPTDVLLTSKALAGGPAHTSYRARVMGERGTSGPSLTTAVVLGGHAVAGLWLGYDFSPDGSTPMSDEPDIRVSDGGLPRHRQMLNLETSVNLANLPVDPRFGMSPIALGLQFVDTFNQASTQFPQPVPEQE